MRRPIVALGALGIVLLVAAALWSLFAPGQLVKYPDELDQTAVARGTVTLYVDPSTGAPSSTPQELPLSIDRNLRVVESTGSEATVHETSVEQIGPQEPVRLQLRYVIDRTSLKNVADPAAFAYIPANKVDREGVYSINFPFGTDAGPYELYKNETGTAYAFRQTGEEIDRDGLTLQPMAGSLSNAPLTDAYVEVLAGLGLRKQMTFAQFAPQLKAVGIDPAVLTEQLMPALTSADRAAVAAMLAAPIPLRYTLSADTRLLVEPTTGAIVSLADVEQTISAAPDLSRLAGLGTTLAKPEYADSRIVQGTLAALENLPTDTRTEVMRLQYAQTEASVADIAAYAEGKASDIVLVKSLIPFGLTILGVVCLLGTAAIVTARKRAVA